MPGPDPKPKDERRRRNKPKSGEWVILTEAFKGPVPKLPTIKNFTWEKSTRDWWKSIWRSVMATQWQESDVHGLIELAMLRQAMIEEGDYKLATAITQKSDRFGLTPKGRKDLRWVVTDEDAESAGLKPDGKLAPLRRLRAVDTEVS
jgi:hypothetical protein